jgi:hypothetical protein
MRNAADVPVHIGNGRLLLFLDLGERTRSPDRQAFVQVRGSLAPRAIQHSARYDPARHRLGLSRTRDDTRRPPIASERRALSAAWRPQTASASTRPHLRLRPLGAFAFTAVPRILSIQSAALIFETAACGRRLTRLPNNPRAILELRVELVRESGMTTAHGACLHGLGGRPPPVRLLSVGTGCYRTFPVAGGQGQVPARTT